MIPVRGLFIPPYENVSGTPATQAMLLDASGEKAAFILQAPKTGSIRTITISLGTVTTPTDTDIRIETVDPATGDPSGTLWDTNTNATLASASVVTGTWPSVSLTADAAVTKGDFIAVVIAPTGTPNFNVNRLSEGNRGFPYCDHYAASAWTKAAVSPVVGIEYSDGSFAYNPGISVFRGLSVIAFNSGSTPDERALLFSLPFSCSVTGFWLWADLDGDVDVVLYDSDGDTVLTSLSIDKEFRASTSASSPFLFLFPASVNLKASADYYLSVKPTSATSLTIYGFSPFNLDADHWDQQAGGTAFRNAERTDGGSWTASAVFRLRMGLILDGIGGHPSTTFSGGIQQL